MEQQFRYLAIVMDHVVWRPVVYAALLTFQDQAVVFSLIRSPPEVPRAVIKYYLRNSLS